MDGKTTKERKAEALLKGGGDKVQDSSKDEEELRSKWEVFERNVCLPKSESLVDVGSGGHAMYMVLAYHIFGDPWLYGVCVCSTRTALAHVILVSFLEKTTIESLFMWFAGLMSCDVCG